MEEANILTPDEEKLLTAVGYLVMRWNYAEHFARMILRQYLSGDSLHDQDHMNLSRLPAGGIEKDLENKALPNWHEPGRSFLEHLIAAFASGRNHRNHIVHRIYDTTEAGGE